MEFYLILKASGAETGNLRIRLLTAVAVMLLSGWMAETGVFYKLAGFVIGMCGWLYIVYEVHVGSAGRMADKVESYRFRYSSLRAPVILDYCKKVILGFVFNSEKF